MSRSPMSRIAAVAAILASLSAGCAQEQEPRSYVQANVIDKAMFQGEWWYANKIIDVSVETDEWGFPGEEAMNFSSADFYATERIRWVIDQNYLYAFRSYEIVVGGNPDAGDPEYIGEPVIAYKIDSHFDIRRQYNPTTGEEYNIIEENTLDRKWYERQFMRVDWSQITMTPLVSNLNLFEGYMGGILSREQAPLYIQDGTESPGDFPKSYAPQFHRASLDFDRLHGTDLVDDPATPDREGDYDEGDLYYMSFVTQEIISPGNVPDPYTGQPVNFCMSVYSNAPYCSSNVMTIRHSFLKIGEHHDYAATDYQDRTRQNHFGFFQAGQWTFDAGDTDDPSDPAYGETQLYNRNATLFRLWRDYHDADGNLIPKSERTPRTTMFFTTPETPRWLVRPSYQLFAEWNEIFATIHRSIRGEPLPLRTFEEPRNWFEQPDASREDIRCWIADAAGEDIPAASDPLPQYDPYNPPGPGDTWTEISGMDAFKNENRLRFYGDECWLIIRVNSCDAPIDMFPQDIQDRIGDYMADAGKTDIDQLTDDELFDLGVQCEERGDLRFHLLSYVDLPAPNVGWLGIATMLGDPITGENIAGDANIGAPALHGYRMRAMDEYDLITGNVSELAYETGEDVREFMDNLGMTMRPSAPARDSIRAGLAVEPLGMSQEGIKAHMEEVMATKAQFLHGTEGWSNVLAPGRLSAMKGTGYERMLVDNDDALAFAGFEVKEDAPRPIDAILEIASPFRADFGTTMARLNASTEYYTAQNCVIMPNSFIDFSVAKFAEDHAGMPRKNLVFEIEQKLYKDTLIHELGHVLGLRHNMRGTADPWNYSEQYYDIAAAIPLPDPLDYDVDADASLDTVEAQQYDLAWNDARHARETAGIETWMTSSMMDYTGNWYERYMPEGSLVQSYDAAAIMFGYGDQVEVYQNTAGLLMHCPDPSAGPTDDCITPRNTQKVLWTYFGGGEACTTDADCPYGSGGPFYGELKDEQTAAGFAQKCGTNPTSGHGMCTNFWADFDAYYATQADPTRPAIVARSYKYCDDYNRPDVGGNDSQCFVFDEGASYREMVENLRETYLRKYIFTYFRRYRATFDYGTVAGSWSRYIFEPVVIFNDMFYRYATEGDAYKNDTGPFGFYDQYLASIDLLNFWMEMISIPDIGAYKFDEYENEYVRFSPHPDVSTATMKIKTGLGRHVYTAYQTGLNGIYRLEYVGTIYDKMFALEALMARGSSFNYSNDDMYFVNFYDVFPNEMMSLLMGLITEEPSFYAPRVVSIDPTTKLPILQYLDFYRGNCSEEAYDGIVNYDECRPSIQDQYGGMPALNDGKTFMLQNYGLLYGLAYLPTYFDTYPQEKLHFYKVGSLDDVDIDPGLVEGTDYIVYTSRNSHTTYLAFELAEQPSKIGGSIAFALMSKLKKTQVDLDDWILCLEDGNTSTNCGFADEPMLADKISEYRYQIGNMESLVNYAIELQHKYGINSYMGYSPSM